MSVDAANGDLYLFYFVTGAFDTPGVHDTQAGLQNPGTLTVEDTSAPEPAALFLAGCGLAIAGIRRWLFRHNDCADAAVARALVPAAPRLFSALVAASKHGRAGTRVPAATSRPAQYSVIFEAILRNFPIQPRSRLRRLLGVLT